jgi:UDP-GlcNAc:undecaprenyl-phosphate GlcNAc-1-phosphate transferase
MTAPLMALAIPILDVCLSIVRRFLSRAPIFGADRGHIHHRLLARGLSPRRVALLLYAVGGLAALLSIVQSVARNRFSFVVLAVFGAGAWVFVSRLGYVEFGAARRALLGGAVRRLVGARIHLENLETALARASTPNDCWLAIRDACRQLGFHDVRLRLLGETYEERFGPDSEACSWTMRIPLTSGDYLNCAREVDSAGETAGIAAFADLIGQTLCGKLPALRPSDSIDPQIAALIERVEAEGRSATAFGSFR